MRPDVGFRSVGATLLAAGYVVQRGFSALGGLWSEKVLPSSRVPTKPDMEA